MSIQIPKMYPTSALTIHLCGKEITLERMEAMFKEVDTPFLPKLAAHFIRSKEEMERILSFAGSAPSQTVEVEEKKEVAPKEEEKEEEKDEDVAFDDFFD